jgi:hypothetical protein
MFLVQPRGTAFGHIPKGQSADGAEPADVASRSVNFLGAIVESRRVLLGLADTRWLAGALDVLDRAR